MNKLEDIPNVEFTPEGRKFEYRLIKESIKRIRNSRRFSEEEKKYIENEFWDYLIQYELLFRAYSNPEFDKRVQEAMRLKLSEKDNGANESWKRYLSRNRLKSPGVTN